MIPARTALFIGLLVVAPRLALAQQLQIPASTPPPAPGQQAPPLGPPQAAEGRTSPVAAAPVAVDTAEAADDEGPPRATSGVGVRLDGALATLRSGPTMPLVTPNGVRMGQFGDGAIGPVDTTLMASFTLSLFLKTTSPIVIPIVGFELGIPLATGYPGTVPVGPDATALTWAKTEGSTYYTGIDVLGIGLEHLFERVGLGFDVRPGFRYLRMTGSLTQGLLTVDAEANRYTFSLHGDAHLCARLGRAASGICVVGGPHLYEFDTWLNGFTIGLRATALVAKPERSEPRLPTPF